MTRFEKFMDINELAKFLDKIVQDCELCPCMMTDICDGFCPNLCVNNFKRYLLNEVTDMED